MIRSDPLSARLRPSFNCPVWLGRKSFERWIRSKREKEGITRVRPRESQ